MNLENTFKRLTGFGRNKRGSAAVEFAITFPILIVITLMIFDVGRALFFYTSVNHLAAEGVRYASVRGTSSPTAVTEDEVVAYITSRATGLLAEDLTISVSYSPDASSGSNVAVTISYNQTFFVSGLIEGLLGEEADGAITLVGQSEMIIL